MAPLIVMLVGWVAFRLAGAVGMLHATASWTGALRTALVLMFVVTGVAHFVPRGRDEMVRMVPPSLPRPDLLVTLTGILELLGAAGLLVPWLARASAFALIALLVAMFPANVRAARMHLTVAGRPAMSLALRLPLQLFWIGALMWVAISAANPGAAG
jgi:uncharacterized membrane protein